MFYLGRLFFALFLISSLSIPSLTKASTIEEKTEEKIDTYKVALSALDLSSYEKLGLIDHGEDPTGFLGYQLRLSYKDDHSFQLFMAGDHKDIPEEVRALGAQVLLLNKTATYAEPYRFKGTFTLLDKVSAFDVLLHPQNGITVYHALTPFDLTIKGTTVINGIPENHFGLIYTPALLIEAKSFDNAYGGVIAKEGMGLQTIDGITNGRGIKKMVPYPVLSNNSNATITAPYYEPDDSYIYCDSTLQMWGKKIVNNFSSINIGGDLIVHEGCELLFNRGGIIDIEGSATVFADNIQIYQERDAIKYDMAATHGAWGTALIDQSAIPVFRVQGDGYFRTETIQLMVPKGTPDPLFVGGKMGTANKAGQVAKLMRHVYDQVAIKHEPPVIPMPDLSGMMSGFGGFERSFGSMSLGSPSFSSSSFTSSHDLRPSHSSNHPLNFRTNVGNVNVSINLGQFTNQILARALKTDEQTVGRMMSMISSNSSVSPSNNNRILNCAPAIPLILVGEVLLSAAAREGVRRGTILLLSQALASVVTQDSRPEDKELKDPNNNAEAKDATQTPQDKGGERKVNTPKAESKIWKELKPYKGKIKTNGESGSKRRYYEWDHTHNDIETYDHNGKHLGSMDPKTGEIYKPPMNREIEL